MSVEAKVDLRKLNKLQKEVFKEGLESAAQQIVSLASQLAPVESGDLSNSGKYEIQGFSKVLISFGNDLPDERAPAQEYGTIDMPAQPYLGPAVNDVDAAQEVFKAVLKELNQLK